MIQPEERGWMHKVRHKRKEDEEERRMNFGYSFVDVREYGFPDNRRTYKGVRKPERPKHRILWADRPPEGVGHPVQQKCSDDFGADWKARLFDGQGCVGFRLFVIKFVSRDDSTSLETLE